MTGGRREFLRDRDINTPGQLMAAMLLSVLAHAILIAAVVTFSLWRPQGKIIVPGYKVDLVTLSPTEPSSLLPPGGPPAGPAEPQKPQPPEPRPKEEPKAPAPAEPKVKAAPPPMKKAKAEPVAKEKITEAPKKIVAKSEEQPKKEPEKKEEEKKIEKEEPSPAKTPALPPIETAAIPPGPSGRTGQTYPGAGRPSGGGVGAGGGGGVVTDGVAFPHMWYLQILERKANENWITHGIIIGGKRADPVVRFRILKNGQVEGITLEKSSGNASLDDSALTAITKASPFPPLPGDYGSDHLTVHFTFTYVQRD